MFRFRRCLPAAVLVLGVLLASCAEPPQAPGSDLLRHVPAETPFVFATSRELPEGLRARLADHYAARLAGQQAAFERARRQFEDSRGADKRSADAAKLMDVLGAILAELDGRDTAPKMRELGIEPVTRSVVYAIGLLPVARVEIADAQRFDALLDRVEQRAGVAADRAELNGQAYRRIDLGKIDLVIAVVDGFAVTGLLPDMLFERDLPLLLGQQAPARSLADSDEIGRLIERYGFTGYGEGYVRLDDLVATMLGKGQGRSAELVQALGGNPLPASDACLALTEKMVAGMPRMVMGVTAADEAQLAIRGIWEASPAVASHLQKLAAPVPGVGSAYDGMLAIGLGLNLPQLRNAIEALLRGVIEHGEGCEWVNPGKLQAVVPQLNLALGPMTAGIKGFSLRLQDLELDPDTLQPKAVNAALLAAVDDPRGIFALGAMFNPALAALEVPSDGTPVDLPLGVDHAPPLKVAIEDNALVLLSGMRSAELVRPLLGASMVSPAPLFAVDYGIRQLVDGLGGAIDGSLDQLRQRGEADLVVELGEQVEAFRDQAELVERIRMSMYAGEQGLVFDQVTRLRQ